MNGQKTILVIDDDKKFSFGLATVLKRSGFQVLVANNGEEGLQTIRDSKPDVILCDIMMPPPNGIQLKKNLMHDPQTCGIPFLFLTARTAPIDKITGLENGADDYITKPFGVDELMARIHSVLRRDDLGHQRGVKESAAAFEHLRQSLSTNISHELRTPLTILLTTLDLIVRKKFADSNEELSEYLMMASKSAYHMKFLVEDLEILYDIDQGQVNTLRRVIDPQFHLNAPIKETFEFWGDKHLDTYVNIHSDVKIYAPRSEFSHVVAHLVDNACKFSPQMGKVAVSVEPNGLGGCIFEVMDEGKGIPFTLREKVFERYYQISQGDTREYGGLGLGLSIARTFARSIGGEVQIVDSPIGCRVRMVLPPFDLG